MQPQKLKLSQTQSLVLRLLHDPTVEGPLAFQRQEIQGGHDSAGASLSQYRRCHITGEVIIRPIRVDDRDAGNRCGTVISNSTGLC